MKKYIRYEVEIRKYSPNAIEGVYLNEEGKEKRDYVMSAGTTIGKKQGDEYARMVCNFLNIDNKNQQTVSSIKMENEYVFGNIEKDQGFSKFKFFILSFGFGIFILILVVLWSKK